MWLGAPIMKRKTACLALAGKCGGLGASGLAVAAWASRERRSIRARPANPPPASQRNSRRVRPRGADHRFLWSALPAGPPGQTTETDRLPHVSLIHISKLVQVEDYPAHLF